MYSVDGHLGRLRVVAVVSNAAVVICVQVFYFISLGYVPRSGTAGPQGNYV